MKMEMKLVKVLLSIHFPSVWVPNIKRRYKKGIKYLKNGPDKFTRSNDNTTALFIIRNFLNNFLDVDVFPN